MSELADMANRPYTARVVTARGRVAGAPANAGEPMLVTLVNYASDYSYEVPASNWMTQGGSLPPRDARCLLVFDDDGDAWVPVWEGDFGVSSSALGEGENQNVYGFTTVPQLFDVRRGSTGTPDEGLAPLAKFVRTQQVTRAQLERATTAGNDGGEQLAAVQGISVGLRGTEVQPVGVYGAAKTSSPSGAGADACGVYGVGRVMAGATGVGIGAFFAGRRDDNGGHVTATEFSAYNGGSTDGVYNSTGASDLKGIWLNANGTADSAVGLQIGNPFGRQFAVGIGFNAQSSGGKVGGVRDSTFRDDSRSNVSIDIRGGHAGGAIVVAAGAGPVFIGAQRALNAASLFEVQGDGTVNLDPIATFGIPGAKAVKVKIQNGNNGVGLFVAAGRDNFLTGTVAGDSGVQVAAAGGTWHVGTSGGSGLLKVNSTGIGFQAAAPIAKPTVTGSRGGNAALASLLTALATYGLIVDGSEA